MVPQRTRWGVLVAAGGIALLILLLALMLLDQEATPLPTVPAPSPTPADPPVAQVEGEVIRHSVWMEAVLLDGVMSRLAGIPAPSPTETLDRLINEILVLRAVPEVRPPTPGEVESRIAELEAMWGVSDDQVVQALAEAGLTQEVLKRTVARFLQVQEAQARIEASGTPIAEWLARERRRARILTYPERMRDVPRVSPVPTPASMAPTVGVPDFTLERAGGGTLALSEQLARGPVVLVFFQRCG
ncbi:MAG: hypothetical protein D6793_03675 [Thermoflexia bacterium]|nr:MAG: hypothetical protein D6793_03675 [Thermoflexia bacterium]